VSGLSLGAVSTVLSTLGVGSAAGSASSAGNAASTASTAASAAAAAQPWVVIGAVVAGGVLFFATAMVANRLLRPQVLRPEKATTYESGVDPVGRGWAQTQIRYYLYAYLYVVFAVDAVYLFPWATVVEELGWATLAEMGVFLGVLAAGLLHAWRRGALRWSVS
jgi:NADH-quinone oxidoreductase subunit A